MIPAARRAKWTRPRAAADPHQRVERHGGAVRHAVIPCRATSSWGVTKTPHIDTPHRMQELPVRPAISCGTGRGEGEGMLLAKIRLVTRNRPNLLADTPVAPEYRHPQRPLGPGENIETISTSSSKRPIKASSNVAKTVARVLRRPRSHPSWSPGIQTGRVPTSAKNPPISITRKSGDTGLFRSRRISNPPGTSRRRSMR